MGSVIVNLISVFVFVFYPPIKYISAGFVEIHLYLYAKECRQAIFQHSLTFFKMRPRSRNVISYFPQPSDVYVQVWSKSVCPSSGDSVQTRSYPNDDIDRIHTNNIPSSPLHPWLELGCIIEKKTGKTRYLA